MKRRYILASLIGLFGGPGGVAAGADEALHPPADAERRLNLLLQQPKFVADQKGLYTGVHDPAERLQAEATVNGVIGDILVQLPKGLHKRSTLRRFKAALDQTNLSDTEDRERAAEYFQDIMSCIGLESSDGLLNTYVYGFDLRQLPTK